MELLRQVRNLDREVQEDSEGVPFRKMARNHLCILLGLLVIMVWDVYGFLG